RTYCASRDAGYAGSSTTNAPPVRSAASSARASAAERCAHTATTSSAPTPAAARWAAMRAELDSASARIAAHLAAAGVGADDVVAVWAHRSAALARALLAALRTGGAFVVLDPAYPASRLAQYVR